MTQTAPIVYHGTVPEPYQLCCKGCDKLIKAGEDYVNIVGYGYHCPRCASSRFNVPRQTNAIETEEAKQ